MGYRQSPGGGPLPTTQTRLTNPEAAAYAGKTPAAWKKARQRRPCPPDGHFGRTPWWYPSTIDKWRTPPPATPTTARTTP